MNSRGAIAGENKMVICYVSYFELHHSTAVLVEEP